MSPPHRDSPRRSRTRGRHPKAAAAPASREDGPASEPPDAAGPFFRAGVGIFVLALLVRGWHVWQLRTAAFFEVPFGDGARYLVWAQEIAGGSWIGDAVFYQAPLYPYSLAVVLKVLGDDLMVIRLAQSCLGALSCVLVGHAAARLFTRRIGIVAGVVLALYAPAIFYDGILQKSVLDLLLTCTVVWATSGVITHPTRRGVAGLGIALAALVLTRENAMVLAPAVLVWLLVHRAWPPRRRVVFAGIFVLAGVATLAPVALRNLGVGGELHLTTSQFGPNFYIGNNENADGLYRPLRPRRSMPRFEQLDATVLAEEATGRSMPPGAVSRYWTRRALDYITTNPGDWLVLVGRKLALAANATEAADTEDQYTYAEWSAPLRVTGLVNHFGILAPLAVAGIVVTWSRRRVLYPLYLMLGAYLLSLLVFYVFGRYRLPLVPFLVVFAAGGLGALVRERRQRSVVARYALVALGIAVLANWPMIDRDAMRAATRCNVGLALDDLDRSDEAVEWLESAVRDEPRLDVALHRLGVIRARQGDLVTAAYWFRRALEIDPAYANAYTGLGNIALLEGRFDQAETHYRRALEIDPASVDAMGNLAAVHEQRGEYALAIMWLERALAIEPGHERILRSLERIGRRR